MDEVKYQIRIRENRRDKLKGKYDAVLKSLGHGAGKNYYLSKIPNFKILIFQTRKEILLGMLIF